MVERKPSGVTGLDALLGGGYPVGSVSILSGAAGAGKTMLALRFVLEGAKTGEKSVFVVTDEKPRHVADKASFLRHEIDPAVVLVLDASPYLTAARGGKVRDPRMLVADLTQQVRTTGASRLVIDGLGTLVPDDVAMRPFVRSLFYSLEDNLGCTVVVTVNPEAAPPTVAAYAESLASVVVALAHDTGQKTGRSLAVRKSRAAGADPRPIPIALDGEQEPVPGAHGQKAGAKARAAAS